MEKKTIEKIIEKIRNVRVAVFGDFCLDAYWILDPKGSEVSVETGLKGEAVKNHYYSLGGASNIVANLASLKPKSIQAIGVVGDDIFGNELKRQLKSLSINIDYLLTQKDHFDTNVFGKRYLEREEKPRIDFGIFNKKNKKTYNLLLEYIKNALLHNDILIFNQQVPGSILSEAFLKECNSIFKHSSNKLVILDSRDYADKINYTIKKLNESEAARISGRDFCKGEFLDKELSQKIAHDLYNQYLKPVFITRGQRGVSGYWEKGFIDIPGIETLGEKDTVGAGDTLLSALSLALAAGYDPQSAAEFANLAATVTIQKLFTTGTAEADEIMEVNKTADFIYLPEIAEDIRRARYHNNTEIEICQSLDSLNTSEIKNVVFDHDGTISVLRQGWEDVMTGMMIKSITGDKYNKISSGLLQRISKRVTEYIDKSTGVETIVQMEALEDMVKHFGLVSKQNILDSFGYKKEYLRQLASSMSDRIEKFKNNEIDITDLTIKGSVDFISYLNKIGLNLYLASGTDEQDVINEAMILGYAHYFNGGIFGAREKVKNYSKRIVIKEILEKNNLKGHELMVVGDGPVELRECRKNGGIAVGVATDEIRRYGLNKRKRERLIKGGAHIIIPDFSQYTKLLNILFKDKNNYKSIGQK